MNRKGLIATAVAIAVLPMGAASANDIGYTYGAMSVNSVDLDFPGLSSETGFGLEGYVGFSDSFHAGVEYRTADFSGVDLNQTSVAFGYNRDLSRNASFFGRVSWENLEAGAADDDGFGLEAGMRGYVAPAFELSGSVKYIDLGGSGGDETFLELGGLYEFSNQFALGLSYETGDSFDVLSLSGRFYFGR